MSHAESHRAFPSPRMSGKMQIRTMAKVGWAMMVHDKLKFAGTVAGVVFAVFLAVQQLGVLFGLLAKNTMFVDNAGADIWIVPPNTHLLQPGQTMSDAVLMQARVTPGVALASPLIFSAASIKKPSGGTEAVTLAGVELPAMLGGPWNVVAGDKAALGDPDTMFFEDAEREKFGGINVGSVREVNGNTVRVGGFTWGLLPFGPAFAFAEIETARRLVNMAQDRMNFVLVKVHRDADVAQVVQLLQTRVPEVTVLTRDMFHNGIVRQLLREQLGVSFGTSTAFGLIIGFVVVALSMFSSVLDKLREFGTLKAIGCTNFDLAVLLLMQSIAYAWIGSFVGLGMVTFVGGKIRTPQLAVIIPPQLMVMVPFVMTALCMAASVLALQRIRKLEPGMVFR